MKHFIEEVMGLRYLSTVFMTATALADDVDAGEGSGGEVGETEGGTGEGEGTALGGEGDTGDGQGDSQGDDQGDDQGDSHWLDNLTDEQKEQIKGLSAEDAIAKLQASAPDEYTLPEDIKGRLEETADSIKDLSEAAREAGITQEQFEAVLKPMLERDKAVEETLRDKADAENLQGLEDMKKELGGDAYGKLLSNAQRVVRAIDDKQVVNWMNESGMGNNPTLIGFLGKLGGLIGEDSLNSLAGGQAPSPKPNAEEGDSGLAKKFYPNMK